MDAWHSRTVHEGSSTEESTDAAGAPFGYLERERLSMAFSIAMERYPVVLLTAPNGYGKTAFLKCELAKSDRPLAWVDMDGRYAVPGVFARGMAEALSSAVPGFEAVAKRYLDAEGGPLERGDYDRIVEEVRKLQPNLCIVLDGYENVDADAVDDFVNYLMEYLPTSARLVIAASRKPNLATNRMRLRGRLFELKTEDFEFTFSEAMSLYNGVLGLDLSFSQAEQINRHMDGWVAGLRMVEVALQSGMDMETALASGGELQRNISQYLADDIVNRQDARVREFLLQTSIFESFCAELCDAALQRCDSADVIHELQERKLFVQHAERPGWFRYANFFRVCLRDLASGLPEAERMSFNVRASEWLAAQGMTEQALMHAIEADDYDQVQAVLAGQFGSAMGQDEVARMNDLIDRLPESIVSKSRWAGISAAIACEMRQSFAEEGQYVEAVLDGPDLPGAVGAANAERSGATLAASLQIVHMLRDYHLGRADEALARGRRFLQDADDLGHHGRCGVLNVMGLAHWWQGDAADARSCWQESANLATYIDWPYSICLNLFGVAHAHYKCGNFESAQETCERIFAISGRRETPVLASGYAHLLMAKIFYDRDELERAANEVRTAQRIALSGKERVMAMNAEMAMARIGLAQGNKRDAVERANRCLSEFCSDLQYRQSFDEAYMLMAQVWLLAGKPDLASGYLSRLAGFDAALPFDAARGEEVLATEVFGSDFRQMWCEEPLFNLLFALIQEGRTEGVLAWLDFVQEAAGKRGLALVVAKTLITKALCAQKLGEANRALGWLAEAMALLEPNGCVRTFADAGEPMAELLQLANRKQMGSRFGARILELLAPDAGIAADAQTSFGETFTRREREIMELLLQGRTNAEISKRLFLSLSTVKNHIHHIYTKLGVRNRAEAIVAMRELEG